MCYTVSPCWLSILNTNGVGDGLEMIKVHYTYCVLYFYYCYISSTSDHQALDPRGLETPGLHSIGVIG